MTMVIGRSLWLPGNGFHGGQPEFQEAMHASIEPRRGGRRPARHAPHR